MTPQARTRSVDLTIYDFGGLSVDHTIQFSGAFEELIARCSVHYRLDQAHRRGRRDHAREPEALLN